MKNALALGSAPLIERSGFPISTDTCPRPSTGDSRSSSKRRLSGPAWPSPQQHQKNDPPLTQSRSSSHIVDSIQASTSNHHRGIWNHPYQYHHRLEAERSNVDGKGAHQHEDSPSPISSDSELPGHDGIHKAQKMFHLHGSSASQSRTFTHMHNLSLDNSPSHYSPSAVRTTTPSDFAFTPSASPFLGPLRTLDIHSTTPSRAPSPILLPASAGYGDEVAAAGLSLPHPRAGGVAFGGSPPLISNSFSHKKQHWGRGDGYGYGTVSSQLPTPQLSSGPSSNESSSGSFIHGPLHSHSQSQLGCSGSRTASPTRRGHGSHGSPPFHHSPPNSNTHLTHSVRAALGMTPIHSHPSSRRSSPPPVPRNTSWSTFSGSWQGLPSSQHQYSHLPHYPLHPMYNRGNPSLPGSRSGSPPIRLPPLKILSSSNPSKAPHSSNSNSPCMENPSDSTCSDTPMVGVKKEKVELPGFSEFEAATMGAASGLSPASSSGPTWMGADPKMSVDL